MSSLDFHPGITRFALSRIVCAALFAATACGGEPEAPWPEPDPRAGFEIRGTVLRHDARDTSIMPAETPCAGCEVRLVPQDDQRAGPGPDLLVRTDERGRYRVIGAAAGGYHVLASSPDGFFGSARDQTGSSGTAGVATADVIVRNGGLSVFGGVRDAAGPVAGAHVAIRRRERVRDVAPVEPRMHTDANGAYRIGGIDPVVGNGEREETLEVCASLGERSTCAELRAAPLAPGEARELQVDLVLPAPAIEPEAIEALGADEEK